MPKISQILYFLLSLFIIEKPTNRNERIFVIFSEIYLPENNIIGDVFSMELKEGQKAVLKVAPKTAKGNPAAIEPGSAVFESSDPSVVVVRQSPSNELVAEIEAIDGSTNESVVITFRADGKAGEGVRPIVGTLDVVATQGDAVVVELNVSDVVDPEPITNPEPGTMIESQD